MKKMTENQAFEFFDRPSIVNLDKNFVVTIFTEKVKPIALYKIITSEFDLKYKIEEYEIESLINGYSIDIALLDESEDANLIIINNHLLVFYFNRMTY